MRKAFASQHVVCWNRETFERMQNRFVKLYRKKAHLHHYLEYIEKQAFDEALENVEDLVSEYRSLEMAVPSGAQKQRQIPMF